MSAVGEVYGRKRRHFYAYAARRLANTPSVDADDVIQDAALYRLEREARGQGGPAHKEEAMLAGAVAMMSRSAQRKDAGRFVAVLRERERRAGRWASGGRSGPARAGRAESSSFPCQIFGCTLDGVRLVVPEAA